LSRIINFETKKDWQIFLNHWLLILVPLIIVASTVFLSIYFFRMNTNVSERKHLVQHLIEDLKNDITVDSDTIVSDLMFLSEVPGLKNFLGDNDTASLENTNQLFSTFSLKKNLYKKIRFIDETGVEVVRINYNNGNPEIVPLEQLQNKSQRYYFKNTFKLKQGEVYVSPLDLNLEQGKVEYPYNPVIRLGTPVFNKKGQKKGVIIINYSAVELLQVLDQNYSYNLSSAVLLNPDGYWLKGQTTEDEFGFMFPEGQFSTFGALFSEVWKKISNTDSGQIQTDSGVFTFITVYPFMETEISNTISRVTFKNDNTSVEYSQYHWKLIIQDSPELFKQISNNLFNEFRRWYIRILSILTVISLILAYSIVIQKIAGKKQKYYELKFQKSDAIVNHSHIVLFQRKNIDGWPMEYVSANVIELCGYTADEFMSHKASYSGMIHPEDRKRVENEFIKGINNDSIDIFSYSPYRIITKEENIRWVSNTTEIIKDDNNTVVFYNGIVQDITDSLEKDTEIRKLSQAFHQSDSTIIFTDLDGNMEYVNPSFTRITGYTREEAIGKNPRILSAGQQQPEFFKKMWEEILNGNTWKGEFINKKKNGEVYYEYAIISLIKNSEGMITNYFAIQNDISDRKQMENDLRTAIKQAEEASNIKSEFLANMSHELRTPLNGILGFVQVLEGQIYGNLNKEQLDYFNIIKESGNHLLEMVNDILDLAKIEAGKSMIKMKPFDFGRMLERSPDIIHTIAFKKQIQIEVKSQSGLGVLNGDETKLKQVIFNLLSNAVKFTEPGKKIGIDAKIEDDNFIVTVWDEGIGISEIDLNKIFDPFEQIKGAKTAKGKGTGLGLAISKRLIELHKGTLTVTSKVGEGSHFIITLPAGKSGEKYTIRED
jgi:PAS domain S-box-containing protein